MQICLPYASFKDETDLDNKTTLPLPCVRNLRTLIWRHHRTVDRPVRMPGLTFFPGAEVNLARLVILSVLGPLAVGLGLPSHGLVPTRLFVT